MTEANTEFLDPELLKEAEATAQRAALSDAAEHLPTTRLPPLTPPPTLATAAIPPLSASFVPPPVAPAHAPFVHPSAPPPAAAPATTLDSNEGTTRYRHEAPPLTKPSWFKALLASTFPPPAAVPGEHDAAAVRRKLVVTCVGFSLFFAAVALVTGLRGAPVDPTLSPVVVAAIVVARAIVAVGAGALSYGLLRIAERVGK
jgi:hypothetical protein